MKAKRILVGVALLAGVAACNGGAAPLLPATGTAEFDGGHTLGSGTRAGDSSTVQTDTTQRGGHTLGGGA
jgi:hypothetical protein